ncbi:MAG: hypothetical protein GY913_32865 [Proteobacteria bacterium]|nr:hypothetical protein [Pseudomonadota bacterium]MCP4921716.1 hypothetical protein [Pseudomonadota bacterium]
MISPDERLERTQWDSFWVPADVTIVEEETFKVLCCPRADTNYNMILRLRAHGREAEAVSHISALHAGVRSLVPVNPQNHTAQLELELERHGYFPAVHHDAYLIRTADYVPRPHPGIEALLVEEMDELIAFQDVNDRAFGKRTTRTRQEYEQFLRDGRGDRIRRALAWDGHTPIAAGGITAHPAHGIGFLWGGGTVPESRHQRAYSAVMEARVRWAASVGLEWVGLYAKTDTSAPVVRRQGFTRRGFMTFWLRPA